MMCLRDLSYEEMQSAFEQLGCSQKFRIDQVFQWLHQQHVTDYEAMKNVPQKLKQLLKQDHSLDQFSVRDIQKSKDGTYKFLFGLHDQEVLEAVWIPSLKRRTLCVSTQVGCALGCRFCSSGLLGLKRNLSSGEILNQLSSVLRHEGIDKITHVVFMGIGEPLQNFNQLTKAIDIINDYRAFHIGARRITVSTAGLIPGIKCLAAYDKQVELAISLHAANHKKRSKLMPINERFPLTDLIQACRAYIEQTGRQITFEYVMLRGVNDGADDARQLVALVRGMCAKVNLIPFNAMPHEAFQCSSLETMQGFRNILDGMGVIATIRTPRGRDITAACGQLRHQAQSQKSSV